MLSATPPMLLGSDIPLRPFDPGVLALPGVLAPLGGVLAPPVTGLCRVEGFSWVQAVKAPDDRGDD